jgi:hypothetical protein
MIDRDIEAAIDFALNRRLRHDFMGQLLSNSGVTGIESIRLHNVIGSEKQPTADRLEAHVACNR